MGIDILQDGSPILVSWGDFLDSVVEDSCIKHNDHQDEDESLDSGGSTPTATPTENPTRGTSPKQLPRLSSSNLARTTVHDLIVDVVISPHNRVVAGKSSKSSSYSSPLQASMIVSVWSIEDTQYFTLTFTSVAPPDTALPARSSSRIVTRTSTGLHLNKSHSSSSSSSSDPRSGNGSNPTSKAATPTLRQVEFPPRGPPKNSKHDSSTTASVFQKASQLKDAILNTLPFPAYGLLILYSTCAHHLH